MLEQILKHGNLDLNIQVKAIYVVDTTVEDGHCFGRCVLQTLGSKKKRLNSFITNGRLFDTNWTRFWRSTLVGLGSGIQA
jgi:hypothetical protein